jgi:GTP-binding protein Era
VRDVLRPSLQGFGDYAQRPQSATLYLPPMTRAGFVTVVGRPNAGKSTLLNRIIGEKLSITSTKPQSTRDRIVGIRSDGDVQMILLDTPGLLNPRYELQRALRHTALRALDEADVIVYVADATDGPPPGLEQTAELDRAPMVPVITALNKTDLLTERALTELTAESTTVVGISALTGDGIDVLVNRVAALLPESPFLYPREDISAQSVRFFVAELIRETALEQLDDEVPYSVACEVEEFREAGSPVYIRAVIHVERESQKRILIGSKGSRMREIGRASRIKIETLVGSPVYLDLWVKILPNWRRDVRALQRLGYRVPEEPHR